MGSSAQPSRNRNCAISWSSTEQTAFGGTLIGLKLQVMGRPANSARNAMYARWPQVQRAPSAEVQIRSRRMSTALERIGVVTHYYSHLSVATLRLESGTLRVGDVIHIRGHTTDFSQRVESLEVNHAPATEVGPNDDFGLKVVQHAREHDVVYKVRP
jgi:hypothetical protein